MTSLSLGFGVVVEERKSRCWTRRIMIIMIIFAYPRPRTLTSKRLALPHNRRPLVIARQRLQTALIGQISLHRYIFQVKGGASVTGGGIAISSWQVSIMV